MEKDNEIIEKAILEAQTTMRANIGGPFGAAIIDQDGSILSVSSNRVLGDHDPTAHAEVNAIREACKSKNTHDLSGCSLYTTAYPCPMCLAAIIWANIKTVYYGCTAQDADAIGFRDDFIYNFIKDDLQDASVMKLIPQNRDKCIKLFEEYKATNKTMY